MLNRWLRLVSGALAITVALGAIAVVCYPPMRVDSDRDASGHVIKQSESPANMTTPFTVVFTAACGLLLYAINGYRITKLAAAGVVADAAPTAGDRAQNYYSTESPDAAMATDAVNGDSPAPTSTPSRVVTTHGESWAVYELADVPFSVIAEAIRRWPAQTQSPASFGGFAFATRRQGCGSHPWIVKFDGCAPIKIPFGNGQGAEAPDGQSPSADAVK